MYKWKIKNAEESHTKTVRIRTHLNVYLHLEAG